MSNYKIQQGETLSSIAKKFGVSWKDIADVNNISNPNLVLPGQALMIPGAKKTNIVKSGYKVSQGETLSSIAKAHGIKWEDLAKVNNIDDPRKLQIGQNLVIPNKPLLPISKVDTSSINDVKKLQSFLNENGATLKVDGIYGKNTRDSLNRFFTENKIDPSSLKIENAIDRLGNKFFPKQDNVEYNNKKTVLDYHKDKAGTFVIVDKKSNIMEVYEDGVLVKKYGVGLGKNKGKDYITGTDGNKGYTGAGIYTVSKKTLWNNPKQEKYFKRLYGENITPLENESGVLQGLAIHEIPRGNSSRYAKLKDDNPNNDDFSWGCINCTKKDYEDFMKYTTPGTKVYVLPEEEGNVFEVKNNKINFTTVKSDKDIRKYNYTYSGTGKYLDPNISKSTYKPASYVPPSDSPKAKKFAETLGSKKQELMNELNLDSDTYDRVAQLAIGTLGAETDFGKKKLLRHPMRSMYNEEKFMDMAEFFGFDQSGRSSGLTQIRHNIIPDKIKAKYNISRDDLMNPEKAAIATVAMLANSKDMVMSNRGKIENMSKSNYLNFLPYAMNQPSSLLKGERDGKPLDPKSNTYVSKVLGFADQTQIKAYGGYIDPKPKSKIGMPVIRPIKSMGGEIGSAIGSLGDLAIPGLGSILSPIYGTIGNMIDQKVGQAKQFNNKMSQINQVTSVYSHGGYLSGREDMAKYNGLPHSKGGIKVSAKGTPTEHPHAEVEGDETVLRIQGKNYVFSKRLKI